MLNFNELLKEYLRLADCSQTDLSGTSGLSPSAISRYLSGERIPSSDSEQLTSLARGLSQIAAGKNLSMDKFSYESILTAFKQSIMQKDEVYIQFVNNFNALCDTLNLSMKKMAADMNFDVSYLYRIRSEERRPSDLSLFIEQVARFVCIKCTDKDTKQIASSLYNCHIEDLNTYENYFNHTVNYLSAGVSDNIVSNQQMTSFLNKMDEFNLDEYIKVIHFDELKVPSVPFQLPVSKYYYGVTEMRNAELDFFKSTILNKSNTELFMCSYMPMVELAEDMDFNKKWMFAIAMAIKKGMHINIVHNLNRPFEELMLGFEAWIPIYMTGQVSPYHIPEFNNQIFHKLIYCTRTAALTGECIDNFYSDGRYYLTNNKHEVSYYKKMADNIMAHAQPLMDIYDAHNIKKYREFQKTDRDKKGDRHTISSALPIYTMPEKLLQKMIEKLPKTDKDKIMEYYKSTVASMENILKDNVVTFDIKELTKEEFENNPMNLYFADLFMDFHKTYSYAEYLEHYNETVSFGRSRSNFRLNYVDIVPFHNMEINILHKKYFIVSKCKAPNIHFIIYHPKMLEAMEKFRLARQE